VLKNNITTLNELKGQPLLKQGGIPVIDGVLANDYPEAAVAANLLGFPVALKICSETVPHKTERAGCAEYHGCVLSGQGCPGDEQ